MIPNKTPKPATTLRLTRCKHCREKFMQERYGQIVHADCIHGYMETLKQKRILAAEKKKRIDAKVERALTRERREKLKKPTEWEKECREIVQKIARLRDRNDGCISCHMPANYDGAWHGSHFRPAGNNAAVQFHLWNIHKACAQCNLFKGGNISAYRPRLVEKIGADKVAWLESQTQVVKTNVEYLKRFKTVMGKRLRRMEKSCKQ